MTATQMMPTRALVNMLASTAPETLAELQSQYPEADFGADMKLGDGDAAQIDDAIIALADKTLDQATTVADTIKAHVQSRIRWHNRLSLVANLVGAGSAIGLIAAVANDLNQFELMAAGLAFGGSAIALLSQYVENSSNSGVSISGAMANLASVNRDLALARGSLDMHRAVQRAEHSLESIIRTANMAVAELIELQIKLGLD